ncbi:MAG: hypothetical protein MJY89_08885 [Bacteroidales bacterium]|nr:hypothetical protein [Bacteroidales bacterium]
MKNIINIFVLTAMAVVAVSCGDSRAQHMAVAENVKVSCNPEVLTLVGEKIPADITITFPAKYFSPEAVMTLTPVLVYQGGEQAGKSVIYQGEKVKDNNKVVYLSGSTMKESSEFTYVPGMEKSHLELRCVVFYGNKRLEVPAIKVADGLVATAMLARISGYYTMKADNYQEVIKETTEGQILYGVNSAEVKGSELRSESIRDLKTALEAISNDPRYTVKNTQIVAYASPEGGKSFNSKLSDKRATSAQKAWGNISKDIDVSDVQIKSIGQDWDGFQEAVQESDIEDKDLILRVLSMYSDPAVREREIRNLSQIYKEINNKVFPELRRARFITEADFKNFTDEELEELSRKAIDVLDEEGLLRVAANSANKARKTELYKKAVQSFGSDRANFNLAALALDDDEIEMAGEYLNAIKNVDADVINAKGVCAMRTGNLEEAAKLFKQSGTNEARANLGTVNIFQGDYESAAKNLAGTKTDNEAVAYLLTGQNEKAAAAISGTGADADYLRAVAAARMGNVSAAKNYLSSAIAKDSSYKAKAANDIEMAKVL